MPATKDILSIAAGTATHQGPRPRNEDALAVHRPEGDLIRTKGIAACIADGVSASAHGMEAARTAVTSFIADYFQTPESWTVKNSAARVLTAINRWLHSQGSGFRSEERGWVTTFTAIILKSRGAHFFHIGDSRLYRFRSGKLEQLTDDHSAGFQGTQGLTRALGLNRDPRIDFRSISLEPGDRFLLTTDGLHGFLPHARIASILSETPDPDDAAALLVAEAGKRSNDNQSCLVIDVESLPDGDIDDSFRRLSALPFPPDLLPGQKLDGFLVERIISASRHSQLYEVSDEETGGTFILKAPSVRFQDEPAFLERFATEEWIGLRTDHPGLTKAVRTERRREFLYYLMEPAPGIPLGTWSDRHPDPPVGRVIEIIGRVIDAVRALHRKETLHQDLKPDNIMIDGDDSIRIIDYGSCFVGGLSEIASPWDRESALGTMDFSAPEYRLGHKGTTRSDLFSIAVIAYHLLTGGGHPYGDAWSSARTPRDFANLTYHPAASRNPLVPPWMDAVLRKALSIRPEARHDCMSGFLQDLRNPGPEFLTPAARPFSERNPLLFWKITAFLALAGWLVTWILLRR